MIMSNKNVFVLSIAFALLTALPILAQTAPSQAAYAGGKKFFDDGNYNEAVKSFLKSVESDGSNIPAFYMLAESYYKLNMTIKALDAYSKTYELVLKQDKKAPVTEDIVFIRDNSGKRIMELDDLSKECAPAQKECAKKLLKVLEKSRKANKTAFSAELCREILALDPQCEDAKKAFKELTGKSYDVPVAVKQSEKKPSAKVEAKKLFNGTDIDGWATKAPDNWKVEDAEIIGKASFAGMTFLAHTETAYKNCYKLSVKMKAESSVTKSGIVFGIRDDAPKFFSASINENGDFFLQEINAVSGDVKLIQQAKVEGIKKEDWNEMALVITEKTVRIDVNGSKVLEAPSAIDMECLVGVLVSNGTVRFSMVAIEPTE